MSDFFKNIIPPPPQPPPPTISPAEFIALRAIVMSLVAATASHYQASVGEPAQDFINFIAASSQEAILGAVYLGAMLAILSGCGAKQRISSTISSAESILLLAETTAIDISRRHVRGKALLFI